MLQRTQRFDPEARSVREARRFVSTALADARGPGHPLHDAACLIVSELASNAVRHAGTSFVVDVAVDSEVVIGVTDRSTAQPTMRARTVDGVDGRGLLLVDRTSDEWGFDADRSGKRVWCLLHIR